MEFFKTGTRYDFIGKARVLVPISGILVLISLGLIVFKGLNFGIEFAGGTEALVAMKQPTDITAVRDVVAGVGLDSPEVVRYGLTDTGRYFVRSRTRTLLTQAEMDAVKAGVVSKLGETTVWEMADETGEEIRVRFAAPKSAEQLAAAAREAGAPGAEVSLQAASDNPIFLLRMPGVRQRLSEALKAKFGDGFREIERLESVGSSVGEQMRNQGALALIYALLGILLYVVFRFDLRFGPGAIVSLLHDVIMVTGVFALFGLEFTLQIVAALLALLGYSINDTVVIFDRIRETEKEGRAATLAENINIAVNETLSRTIMTSLMTLVAVAATYLLGGEVTRNFALAMMLGILFGSYSTIYIASPLTLLVDRYYKKKPVTLTKAEGATSTSAASPRATRP